MFDTRNTNDIFTIFAFILIRSRKHSDPKLVFSGIKQTNHGEKRINHVVKYDIGRACRLGQKNKINVIRVLTRNTIEEDIFKKHI